MSDSKDIAAGMFLLGLGAGAVIMAAIAISTMTGDDIWHAEAIEHGCAAYDEKTGEWGWLND